MKVVTGAWQYADGSPVSGTIYFQLSADARVGAQIAPRIVSTQLDANGAIPAGFKLYANDELTPSNLVYIVTVVAAGGNAIYDEYFSLAGASPFALGNFIPTLVA